MKADEKLRHLTQRAVEQHPIYGVACNLPTWHPEQRASYPQVDAYNDILTPSAHQLKCIERLRKVLLKDDEEHEFFVSVFYPVHDPFAPTTDVIIFPTCKSERSAKNLRNKDRTILEHLSRQIEPGPPRLPPPSTDAYIPKPQLQLKKSQYETIQALHAEMRDNLSDDAIEKGTQELFDRLCLNVPASLIRGHVETPEAPVSESRHMCYHRSYFKVKLPLSDVKAFFETDSVTQNYTRQESLANDKEFVHIFRRIRAKRDKLPWHLFDAYAQFSPRIIEPLSPFTLSELKEQLKPPQTDMLGKNCVQLAIKSLLLPMPHADDHEIIKRAKAFTEACMREEPRTQSALPLDLIENRNTRPMEDVEKMFCQLVWHTAEGDAILASQTEHLRKVKQEQQEMEEERSSLRFMETVVHIVDDSSEDEQMKNSRILEPRSNDHSSIPQAQMGQGSKRARVQSLDVWPNSRMFRGPSSSFEQ